jgi:hypothetical protein
MLLAELLGIILIGAGWRKFFIRFQQHHPYCWGCRSSVIACLAAYAFARMNFPGKKTLFNLILSLMVVPPVVMVVPLFVSWVRWGMINTYHGTILIYTGLLLPFSIYLMTNFFKAIPREIIEARIDGCSSFDPAQDHDATFCASHHHLDRGQCAVGME